MKKYLNYLEGEKESILEQHRSAIRKNLLLEDEPSLPNKTILGTGVDKYDYKRENGKYFTKQKNATSWTDITGTKYEQPVRQNIFKDVTTTPISTSNKGVTSSKVPFTNRTEGDKFRQWVNKNHPNIAKSTALDTTSQYFNNVNINNAWNSKVGNQTLGSLYMGEKPEMKDVKKQTSDEYLQGLSGVLWKNDPIASKEYGKFSEAEPDPYGTKAVRKREIELMDVKKIPQIFKGEGGDRLNREVFYIKERPEYDGKPFLVVDPRMKLLAAFDSNHNFIRLSQTIEGADQQRTTPLTAKEWCEAIPTAKYIPKKGCTKPLANNYDVLKVIEARASSAGVYKGSKGRYEKGYLGKSGVSNVVDIRTKLGLLLPMAIHSLVATRIEPDSELKKFLGDAQKTGKIPQEYTDLVNNMMGTGKFDKSSGCFNVDPAFLEDSKVQSLLDQDPYVFVMGESADFYMVQVDPSKGGDFFTKLGGDGEFCKPPTSVAKEVGGKPIA